MVDLGPAAPGRFWLNGRFLPGVGLGSYEVRPNKYWPTVVDGTRPHRVPAHPVICWLARWLPIAPYVEIQVPNVRDADMILDNQIGVIFCSPAQANALRQELENEWKGPLSDWTPNHGVFLRTSR